MKQFLQFSCIWCLIVYTQNNSLGRFEKCPLPLVIVSANGSNSNNFQCPIKKKGTSIELVEFTNPIQFIFLFSIKCIPLGAWRRIESIPTKKPSASLLSNQLPFFFKAVNFLRRQMSMAFCPNKYTLREWNKLEKKYDYMLTLEELILYSVLCYEQKTCTFHTDAVSDLLFSEQQHHNLRA